MRGVWTPPDVVVPFVAALTGLRPNFGNCVTMAVIDRNAKMVAGLIFHNWDDRAGVIEVSAAASTPRWATKGVINEALAYCYGTADCQMVVARFSESNKAAHRLWVGLGAQTYVIPRLRGRDEAETIATLTDDAWASSKLKR